MGLIREGRVRLAMTSQVVETCGDGSSGKDEQVDSSVSQTSPRRFPRLFDRGPQAPNRINVLLVEDDPGDADYLEEILLAQEERPVNLNRVETLRGAIDYLLEAPETQVVLLDLGLPDSVGMDTFRKLIRQVPEVPVVVLTGLRDSAAAVEAVREGAQDYLVKGEISAGLLYRAMRYAVERHRTDRMLRENEMKFRLLFEEAPIPYQSLGEDDHLVAVNKAWLDALGYKWEDVSGRNFGDFLTPHGQQGFVVNFPVLRKEGQISDVELEMVRADGSTITVLFEGRIASDEQGITKRTHCVFQDITDKKQAEQALRENEERFRTVADFTYDWEYWIGTDDELLFVSPSCERITGYSAQEFLDDYSLMERIIHPDDMDDVMKHFHVARKVHYESSYSVDFRIIHRDGQTRWINHVCRPVYGKDGNPLGRRASNRNITDRKRAEETLRENEERFRSLFENSLDAILLTIPDGRILMANPAACQMFDLTEEEICLGGREGLVDVTDPRLKLALEERKRTGKFQGELNFKRKDGAVFPAELSTVLFTDANGGWKSTMIIRDVAGRRRSEEAQRRLATAVEQAAEAIVITDKQGTIQYVNPAFGRITGYPRDDVIGKNPRILKSGEHDEEFYKELWDTISRGDIWAGRLINKRQDGSLYQEDATISPVLDASGRIVNYVAVKRDVTREVELHNQLVHAQKMESLGTMAGGIAHDFNNLLTVILGYSELLQADEGLPERVRADLQKILYAGRNGADLVKRLLTFGRKAETKPRPLNLNQELKQLQKLLQRTIAKMIRVELHLAEGLHAIHADPGQLEQILLNLAVNAEHAMREAGRLILETENVTLDEDYCSTHLEANPGHYVLLTVSDTGRGMDKQVLEHIFEPFFTTKGPGEGTGLGLAMVFGIVKAHGGYIRCYSEPGVGTTFRMYFPAIRGEFRKDEETLSVLAKSEGGHETILLVDDEEFVRSLGERILRTVGYQVITACSGKEALEVYRQQQSKPDLVILDLIMPEMGGTECLQFLLAEAPGVKVIIASGFSPNGPSKAALEEGAKGFVKKPYDIRELLKAVREVLDKG